MKINLRKYNTFILCFYINSFFLAIIFKIFNILIPLTLIHIFLLFPVIWKEKFNKLSMCIILFFSVIILETIYYSSILSFLTIVYIKIFIAILISIFYINLKISLKLLKRYLKYFLFINLIFLISLLKNKNLYDSLELTYMSWGYNCLPIILFIVSYYQETLKYRYLLMGIFSLFLLFLYGSRFGFLLGFIGTMYFLYQSKNKFFRYGIVLGIIFSFFILLDLKEVMLNSIEILNKINLPTESLKRIVKTLNNFIDGKDISSGRNIIYIQTIETIKENFLFGSGIFGYIGKIDYRNVNGTFYPHNIFLEILLHFGIIGFIVFFIIIFFTVRKIYFERKKGYKIDNIYFVSIILSLKLLLSNSYLMEMWFWFALLIPFNRSYYKTKNIK